MAPIWCNWCMLTKQAWMEVGHVYGEKWSINKLHDIRQLVEDHKYNGLHPFTYI
jgi:hypothetical protein